VWQVEALPILREGGEVGDKAKKVWFSLLILFPLEHTYLDSFCGELNNNKNEKQNLFSALHR
jgi:hypothetical protein